MKIQAVTPSEAASDPLHPDHDRWVKETTLKMEVEHAKRIGLSLRHAETENAHWLQRAEARAREAGPAATATPGIKKRKTREERLADRPVDRRAATKKLPDWFTSSPCGRCGTCRGCKRERRIYALVLRAKVEQDPSIAETIKRLWLSAMQARDLTGKYFGMSKRDANRLLTRELEDICDSTVMKMGPWR